MARDGSTDTIMTRSFIDFVLIPSIVSNMVRVLMKDSKRVEALRVCRAFIGNHRTVLARYERRKKCPPGMEMAWTFSACISSVLGICLDVQDAEKLEDIGLLDRLAAAVRDEQGGSKVARMNAKFHLAVGQLLLEARDILLSLPEGDLGTGAITSESVLDLMRRVDTGTFSTKPSSLTPQNSLSTPRASAMASMASMISSSTRLEAGRSMENIDLDQMRSLADVSGDLDAVGGEEHHLRRASHQRSISLHQPTMESVFSSGSMSSNATTAEVATPAIKPAAMSLLDAEAAIDGHAAPLFLILGKEDDEITTPWIPTYLPVRSIWPGGTDSCAPVRPDERKRVRATITEAANAFFERCNYVRTAGVLSVQLADDAYDSKDFATATAILLQLAERLEEENWTASMYEDVMLRLVHAQVRDGDNGIVGTCHRLLRFRFSSTHASMLLRATELAASHDRLKGDDGGAGRNETLQWMNGDAEPVISLDPCLRVLRGGGEPGPSTHFVGDSVSVSVRLVNDSGVTMTLGDVQALFTIEKDEAGVEHGANPPGASLVSPRVRHLMVEQPSPASPSSPFFSSQSPAEDLNSALRWEAAVKLAVEPATVVGTLAAGEMPVTVSGPRQSPEDSQELEFLVNPTVPGIYSLEKLRGSINGTPVEVTPDSGLVQLRVEPPEPRIRVETMTRTLISGEEQWLGVEVDVLRDDSGPPTAMNVEWPSFIRPGSPSAIVNGERTAPDDGLNVPNTFQYRMSRPSSAVWWRARVDKLLDVPPEDVRVSCGWSPKPRGGGAGGPGTRTNPWAAFQPSHPNSKSMQQQQTVVPMRLHHLPLSVLFEGEEQRCTRVVSASALVAVDLPFMLRTDAKEVRKGVILMTMHITSTSSHRTVAIHGVELRPQQGFSVARVGSGPEARSDTNEGDRSQGDILGPTSSMCASFLLTLDASLLDNRAVAQATVYRTGKLAPSVASISYSVVADPDWTRVTGPTFGPPTPSDDSTTSSTSDMYRHEHSIALQLSSISTDSSANNEYVSLRMLGPFSATIGCPVTLVWQLERVGGPDEPTRGGRPTGISYEVRADAACWAKSSRSQGTVALGRPSGSMATVELAWTPTTIGAVPVPTLRLHDVYYVQEARGRNMINVIM